LRPAPTTTHAAATRSFVHLREGIEAFLRYARGSVWSEASMREKLQALSVAVRRPALDAMRESERRYQEQDAKRLYYLSMEFLMGRALGNNLTNLGLYDDAKSILAELGSDLEEIAAQEPDAALGNGGLGRLAACFLDSLATMDMPGFGYGINYEFGLFRQTFVNGFQQERPDHWLDSGGSPWLIERSDDEIRVPVYGSIAHTSVDGVYRPAWVDFKEIIGVPHDMPIVGYGGTTVNVLRLFTARSSDEFDIGIFNAGDYISAVQHKINTEAITKILYPSDSVDRGRELRLLQEYFLVACSVRDILRRYRQRHDSFDDFAERIAIQLNDTHPALTVAELMRTFIDELAMPWEQAWAIVVKTCGYTNHTLLPEALEKWPIELMERVLPRHLQIIGEINRRLLLEVERRFPGDIAVAQRVSIFEEGERRNVRMANLAMAGSHSINGVAALHSELVKTTLAPDFYKLWPERFNNKTNGVTPRRWLQQANPALSRLITEAIGAEWIADLSHLRKLTPLAQDASFRARFRAAKREAKTAFADWLKETSGVIVDPDSIFDSQIKRIHEYKRQLLNILHVVVLYNRLRQNPNYRMAPHTFFFAGKAAPAYHFAKLIIKLITRIAATVDEDPVARDRLKVLFLPEYNVSLAERLIPASDVSEQISTAGYEASGTGNMKFMMNGALTIGTRDGATIEMANEAGEENFFLFGLTAQQVQDSTGWYNPQWHYANEAETRAALDLIFSNHFNRKEPGLFDPVRQALLDGGDHYRHLADLTDYGRAHRALDASYADPEAWSRKAIMNVGCSGWFSSDRTIKEYAQQIWNMKASPVT
jgi:glycogen phosphorylase